MKEMKEELLRIKCKLLQNADCVVERGGEITIEWRCTAGITRPYTRWRSQLTDKVAGRAEFIHHCP